MVLFYSSRHMKKQKDTPGRSSTNYLTKDEQRDIVRYLLRPDNHIGLLHLPKDVYFDKGVIGLNHLVRDLLDWLGYSNQIIHVKQVGHIDTWDATLSADKDIPIPEHLISKQPFLSAYMACIGVCAVLLKRLLPHKKLSREDRIRVLLTMSVDAGLGVYGLNALHETPNKTIELLTKMNTTEYALHVQAYCRRNNIPFTYYEQFLLPDAQKSLQLHSPKKQKPFIKSYVRKQKTQKEIKLFFFLYAIALIVISLSIWGLLPKPLNKEQRAMQSTIHSLKIEHEACQEALREMADATQELDILATRSLRQKHSDCETIKQVHDQTVRKFNHSLR